MDIKEQRERDKYKKTMSGGKEEKPFGSGKILVYRERQKSPGV